ncbi:protein-glutamate O-methyltransferase CheR [Sphingomonas sp. 28-63-12]|uniref:CheR family methyltransferase n=1 Tax=Sphingomonas sp. 28-63-12 TaxID=1970434 RepID=UPI000BC7CAB0|nr:MAG: chemotaxis protein CheR [Sphingomonas sp. 28-63-12]
MTVVAALLEARTGQQIAANRTWRIETALKPVLRVRGLETLDQLVAELLADQTGIVADQIVDALLNQESSFFRDSGVLDMVVEAIDQRQEEGQRRLRIWSAACSTGQEPLSLAMLFADRLAQTGKAEPEILATDVSEAAISRARAARYSQFEIQRGLPVRQMIKWFEAADSDWVAHPELVRKINFRRHNLVGDPAPIGRFDIVLCRNVLLYLSPTLRKRVFDLLAQVVRPGGLLVLGAGETVIGQTGAFVPSPQFRGLYERIATPAVQLGSVAA